MTFLEKKLHFFLADEKICSIFASAKAREHSSVGLERLPYKQRVGGSTPSAPTEKTVTLSNRFFLFLYIEGFHEALYNLCFTGMLARIFAKLACIIVE